ncbi:hypothetical protein NMY22_g5474 [Coprinellus aureogranulatus]|nr:hypothetical protein NMY22_g5474 [Coprinellus aureogranulatus]
MHSDKLPIAVNPAVSSSGPSHAIAQPWYHATSQSNVEAPMLEPDFHPRVTVEQQHSLRTEDLARFLYELPNFQEEERRRYRVKERRLVAHYRSQIGQIRADADQTYSDLLHELHELRHLRQSMISFCNPPESYFFHFPLLDPKPFNSPTSEIVPDPGVHVDLLKNTHPTTWNPGCSFDDGHLHQQIPDPCQTRSPEPPSEPFNVTLESGPPAANLGYGTPQTATSEESGYSSDSEQPPCKRVNHHDKRSYTIQVFPTSSQQAMHDLPLQHAMRMHLLFMLGIDSNSPLPESHVEGTALDDCQPVRFIWEKTSKQSIHNSRMKIRVIEDLKEKRHQYEMVPGKYFGKKSLDAAFEQCFSTFRSKYRDQKDPCAALMTKRREEMKARKARHSSRRKIKLNHRAEIRLKLPNFGDLAFDPALRIECMSSEESDWESGVRSPNKLRTRGYAWRSSRLVKFYGLLDEEEESAKSTQPKRGAVKRVRVTGPTQEDILPPQGVATWMISRRWYKTMKSSSSHELSKHLQALVTQGELPEENSAVFEGLGNETDVSEWD